MNKGPALPPFNVSQAATDQIQTVGGVVRVDITPGGCCGSTYLFSGELATPTDSLFGCEGAILAVTPNALAVLTGSRLQSFVRWRLARTGSAWLPSEGADAVGSRVGRNDTMLTDTRLDEIALAASERGREHAPLLTGLMLAEETGEAIQKLRRYLGHARQRAAPDDVAAELADVVITAAVLARLLRTDLAQHVADKLAEGVR